MAVASDPVLAVRRQVPGGESGESGRVHLSGDTIDSHIPTGHRQWLSAVAVEVTRHGALQSIPG